MKNRKSIFLLIFSLTFNVAFLAALGYKTWGKKESEQQAETRTESRRGSSGEQRTLSPEWRAHFERMHNKFMPEIKPVQEQLNAERKGLGQLLLAEFPDTLQIETRLQNICRLQAEIERNIVYFVFEEKKLFNPEDRQKYLERVIRRIEGGSSSRDRSGRRGERQRHPDKQEGTEKEEKQ